MLGNQEFINCNLCGRDSTRLLIKRQLFNIVQCKACGLIYENPRLTEAEDLKNIIADGVEVEHKKEVWYDAKIKLFQNNLKRIERIVSKGKLLDVGCGYGTFLEIARNNSWQVEGVEIAESASRYTKEKLGIRVFKSLGEIQPENSNLSLVTFWEVLNQMYHPQEALLEAKKILRPGGLVALRLQNAAFHVHIQRILMRLGSIHALLGSMPFIFHRYIFSADTIKKMLEKAGFKDIKIYVSEFTSGDPYASAGVLGSKGMAILKSIIFYACQSIYCLTGRRLLLSPTMLVFARKP